MNQTYLCPRCNSQIKYGDRFCGSCGLPLNWQPQAPPPPYSYQGMQQQGWNQAPAPNPQTGWQQSNQYQQQSRGYQNPHQQQYPYTGYAPNQKQGPPLLIIFLIILIIILFTVGGIGIATKGTFSFS